VSMSKCTACTPKEPRVKKDPEDPSNYAEKKKPGPLRGTVTGAQWIVAIIETAPDYTTTKDLSDNCQVVRELAQGKREAGC